MIADQDVVRAILASREETLRRLFLSAWGRWWKNPERLALSLRRTRACVIHNYMVNEAPIAFAPDKRIHITERDETLFFQADSPGHPDDSVRFRVKKGDEHGISRNIETQSVLQFIDPQGTLPLLKRIHHVDAVYILNTIETQIERIAIVARDHDRCAWSYSIYPVAEGEMPAPLEPPKPPSPPPAGNVIRLPKGRKKDGSNEGA